MNAHKAHHIVITGPESTGKTALVHYLANTFNGTYVPEYARAYIERINRPYTYQDVVKIAGEQVLAYQQDELQSKKYIFYDTWLIITKIWFIEVYGCYPPWIDKKLRTLQMDLYLLCAPDIPWISDPVRENGGESRNFLFMKYQQEIENLGIPYYIIKGKGIKRFRMAEKIINNHFQSA